MKKVLLSLLLSVTVFSNAQFTTQPEVNAIAQSVSKTSSQQLLQATDYKIQAAGGFIAAPLAGKTLVTLGDSITQEEMWQLYLCGLTGLTWDDVANYPGNGTTPPMGVSGSQVVPEIRPNGSGGYTTGHAPGQSIWHRAKFVKDLHPDIIIVFGGQNDAPPSTYSITDPAYTGNEFIQGDGTVCTFVSAYKSMLLQLMNDNPTAKIYVMTRMYNGGASPFPDTNSNYSFPERINVIIRDIAKRYSIPVIDLMAEVGITPINMSLYYRDGTVHPNAAGGLRMAELIAKKIK